MKARIDNGIIRRYNIPPNEWKHYLNFSQADESVLKSEGFFDVVEPEYDPAFWRLGEIYFDEANQVFTYPLIEIPLEDVKQQLYSDFEQSKRTIRMELLEALVHELIELNRDKLPVQLVGLYDALLAENTRVKTTIEELSVKDPDTLRKFRIIPEDVQAFVDNIKPFKL